MFVFFYFREKNKKLFSYEASLYIVPVFQHSLLDQCQINRSFCRRPSTFAVDDDDGWLSSSSAGEGSAVCVWFGWSCPSVLFLPDNIGE